MAKPLQVPITMRSLIQRINRKLTKEGKQLKTARGDRQRAALGDYYVFYIGRGVPWTGSERVVAHHVNPEELGDELEVFWPRGEKVVP